MEILIIMLMLFSLKKVYLVFNIWYPDMSKVIKNYIFLMVFFTKSFILCDTSVINSFLFGFTDIFS